MRRSPSRRTALPSMAQPHLLLARVDASAPVGPCALLCRARQGRCLTAQSTRAAIRIQRAAIAPLPISRYHVLQPHWLIGANRVSSRQILRGWSAAGCKQPTSCPSGHFCLQGCSQPVACSDDGFICPEGSATPVKCGCGNKCPAVCAAQTICPVPTRRAGLHQGLHWMLLPDCRHVLPTPCPLGLTSVPGHSACCSASFVATWSWTG